MSTRAVRQTSAMFVDARTIALSIVPALEALRAGLSGWPSSTPGAAPVSSHQHIDEDPVPLTSVERAALAGDPARTDLERLLRSVAVAEEALRVAAVLSRKWAGDAVSPKASATYDGDIWCENCLRIGRSTPRDGHSKLCDFCGKFSRDFKRPAPKEVWDIRDARGGRISQLDVVRILTRLDADLRARKKGRKTGR